MAACGSRRRYTVPMVLGLAIGVLLVVVAVISFMRREEVAERLARSYAQRPAPAWMPTILRKRFGIRETRVISIVLPLVMAGVGCQQIIAALR